MSGWPAGLLPLTRRYGEMVNVEDPWGFASSLEWATSCPPPRHNFYRIPRVRPERPAPELHEPHIKTGLASRGPGQTLEPPVHDEISPPPRESE